MLGSTWRRGPTKKVGSDLELVIPESGERVTSAVTAKKSDQLRSKTLSTEVLHHLVMNASLKGRVSIVERPVEELEGRISLRIAQYREGIRYELRRSSRTM